MPHLWIQNTLEYSRCRLRNRQEVTTPPAAIVKPHQQITSNINDLRNV